MTVAAAGFEGYKQENVTVDALETVAVNVKLTVGQANETVTVTSAPPLLETHGCNTGRGHGQRDVFEPADLR